MAATFIWSFSTPSTLEDGLSARMRCWLAVFGTLFGVGEALRYSEDQIHWNLNQQKDAVHPVDYWGEWENHTFHPSPSNWRIPFYAITLDRYVDGDPTNNLANGTAFEHDWMSNQFRFGGDAIGMMNNLDYIQGMGIKVYIQKASSCRHPAHFI
jgi:alpha-1,3-glucan synthase